MQESNKALRESVVRAVRSKLVVEFVDNFTANIERWGPHLEPACARASQQSGSSWVAPGAELDSQTHSSIVNK
jgi:hypothetical protein